MNQIAALIAILSVFLLPSFTVSHIAMLTGAKNHSQAQLAIDRGRALFRQGDVEGSLSEFEKAIELDPNQRAHLWEMGISLYYLNRFKEGAEQFRLDAIKNSNDTEESIWCFLCEAQFYGAVKARKKFLKRMVHRDQRPVMRKAYKIFKDGGDLEKFVNAFSRKPEDYLYASLYVGLYYEAQDEENASKRHIVIAYKSPYGQSGHDYMRDVAKVHCQRRNWITSTKIGRNISKALGEISNLGLLIIRNHV
ncbi:Tetratricopeptide repeat (TPR)-like superfamily protein [Euphorbia peplus]|nr:Tetratricopeptide repeat (TPR)-like superfamily protein [Euphorbia peplus]